MKVFSISSRVRTRLLLLLLFFVTLAHVVLANETLFGLSGSLDNIDASRRGVDFEIVTPLDVDEQGNPIPSAIDPSEREEEASKCYAFEAFNSSYLMCVIPNNIFPPKLVIVTDGKDGQTQVTFGTRKCYYRGALVSEQGWSEVAISVCNGMSGLIRTSTTEIFIEPLPVRHYGKFNLTSKDDVRHHIVYRRQLSSSPPSSSPSPSPQHETSDDRFCNVTDSVAKSRRRRRRRRREMRRRRRATTSTKSTTTTTSSSEHWTETLLSKSGYRAHMELMIVADWRMLKDKSTTEAQEYILTLMNIVDSLFSDNRLGLAMKISVVRLKMLSAKDDFDLGEKVSPGDALRQFQAWQKKERGHAFAGRPDPVDAAVLLTGSIFCTKDDCNTIGQADIGQMCDTGRGAVIARNDGLSTAFVVAHELGHALDMQHDDLGLNPCRQKDGFIMSSAASGMKNMFGWSNCSKSYVENFLKTEQSSCLSNWPDNQVQQGVQHPGEIYTLEEQCRFLEPDSPGPCDARALRGYSICANLCCWANKNKTEYIWQMAPAADGTACGSLRRHRKVCWKGECRRRPKAIDGGWSPFYTTGECSRSCGGGIVKKRRSCTEPKPQNGGFYCKGSSVQWVVCNPKACPDGLSSRDGQCAWYDSVLQHGKSFVSVIVQDKPNSECELRCKSRDDEDAYVHNLLRSVDDGTPCTTNDSYRCVSGRCQVIGCDNVVGSTKVMDKCDECGGDGTSCKTISKTVDEALTRDGYNFLRKFNEYTKDILIEEVTASSATYFVFRDEHHKTILDGRNGAVQTVQYEGLRIHYGRFGDGREHVTTDGKLEKAMSFGVIYDSRQGASSPIKFKFVRSKLSSRVGRVEWKTSSWKCSVSCGSGQEERSVTCYSRDLKRTVPEGNCENLLDSDKPVMFRACQDLPECLTIRWVADKWSRCNNQGSLCQKSRMVNCYEMRGETKERQVPAEKCSDMPKPEETMPCSPGECSEQCVDESRYYCRLLLTLPESTWKYECQSSDMVSSMCCATCNSDSTDSSGADDSTE